MPAMLRKIYSTLKPSSLKKIINYLYLLHQFRRYKPQIEKFKNIHKNERCFIIGTGPSLNKTNFNLIKKEILFGVNTLYRGYKKFGIKCQYYACSDKNVLKNNFKDILRIDTTLFLSSGAAKEYLVKKNLYKKMQKREPILLQEKVPIVSANKFPKDITKGVYWGGTVIIDICLPVAYYMGFSKVYLLGCDCDYSGVHRFDGSKTDTMGMGASGEWEPIFTGYRICKKAFEEDNREIINVTVGGKLEIFKRQKLEQIIR